MASAALRGVPPVLRVPAFRDVWLATVASNAGTWLQNVAAGWLIFQLTGSAAAVGALALLTRAPAIFLSPYAGHLADRFDRRKVAVVALLAQTVGAGGLAVLSLFDAAGLAAIYVFTFLVGAGFALGLPAILALIPTLGPRELLSQSVSLNAAGVNVARLAGPAIGGVTLALAGATVCFALNAVSFLALVWALSRVGPRPAPAAGQRAGAGEAFAYARRDAAVRRLLIGMAVFTGLASTIQELAPVVADRLDAGPEGLGLLLGAMGAGGLLGAYLLERSTAAGMPRSRALPLATLVFAVGLAAVAVAPTFALTMGAMAFAGVFWIWMFAGTNTAIQLRSPPQYLGRMLGFYQLAVVAPIAVGPVIFGVLAEEIGIVASLVICALVLAAWGAWSLLSPVRTIDVSQRDEGVSR